MSTLHTAVCEWCNRGFTYQPSPNPKKVDRPRFCTDECVRHHHAFTVTYPLTHLEWPGPWAKEGACAQPPHGVQQRDWTDIWFGGDDDKASDICRICPVLARCNKYALQAGPALRGTWGGLTEKDRARIRRARHD